MDKKRKHKGKKAMRIIVVLLVLCLVIAGGFFLFLQYQMSKLSKMSFIETLQFSTKGEGEAVVTVGIIKDGKAQFQVYGENAQKLDSRIESYEIGSLTKTFTSLIAAQGIVEGKLTEENSVGNYLSLPQGNYPTVGSLLSHSSGLKGHYLSAQMATNFLKGEDNDFYGIDKEELLAQFSKRSFNEKDYNFKYSNFGMSVLGLVLEEAYGEDYGVLMENMFQRMKMKGTYLAKEGTSLPDGWNWKENDGYRPAGAVISNIEDMLLYLDLQIENKDPAVKKSHQLLKRNVGQVNEKTGVVISDVAMGWMYDNTRDIYWHNGGTTNYNCYMAYDLESKTGVVLLANLPPNKKIPVTVSGIKVMDMLILENKTIDEVFHQ